MIEVHYSIGPLRKPVLLSAIRVGRFPSSCSTSYHTREPGFTLLYSLFGYLCIPCISLHMFFCATLCLFYMFEYLYYCICLNTHMFLSTYLYCIYLRHQIVRPFRSVQGYNVRYLYLCFITLFLVLSPPV